MMLTVPPDRIDPTPLPALDPLLLAGTVCARLCHDLAGSVGALTGTLEMAAEENDKAALVLSLALAQELTARLRLLRAAWGTGSDLPDLASLQPGFPAAERLKLDTEGLEATDEQVRRLALSLMMAAVMALPRGGVISVQGNESGLAVAIEGPRAAWPEVLRFCVADEGALLEACEAPRAMPVVQACLQARALGMTIRLQDETHLSACPTAHLTSSGR